MLQKFNFFYNMAIKTTHHPDGEVNNGEQRAVKTKSLLDRVSRKLTFPPLKLKLQSHHMLLQKSCKM